LNKYHVLCETNGEKIKLVVRAKNEQQMIKECKKTKTLTKIISYKLIKVYEELIIKKESSQAKIKPKDRRVKLNEENVKEIRELLTKGYNCSYIGRIFNVGDTAIRKIRDGETWKKVV
jgi:nitrate reductase NapAB chaperone NapD